MVKILHEKITACFKCPYCVNIDGYDASWCEHSKAENKIFPELAFDLPPGWIAPWCPLPEE